MMEYYLIIWLLQQEAILGVQAIWIVFSMVDPIILLGEHLHQTMGAKIDMKILLKLLQQLFFLMIHDIHKMANYAWM